MSIKGDSYSGNESAIGRVEIYFFSFKDRCAVSIVNCIELPASKKDVITPF